MSNIKLRDKRSITGNVATIDHNNRIYSLSVGIEDFNFYLRRSFEMR